jgi:hypothetical protein
MMGIKTPQTITFNGAFLNIVGESVEQRPKTARCERIHFEGGQCLSSRSSRSVATSLNRRSSLPAAESRSICSSQNVSSRARNQLARRR